MNDDTAGRVNYYIPLTMQWWYTEWGEASAYMNFDLKVVVLTDIKTGATKKA